MAAVARTAEAPARGYAVPRPGNPPHHALNSSPTRSDRSPASGASTRRRRSDPPPPRRAARQPARRRVGFRWASCAPPIRWDGRRPLRRCPLPLRHGPRSRRVPTGASHVGRLWPRLPRASTLLTRALGRPIRDQVTSVRAQEATTLQALELVNGEILTNRLMRGARRMVGELPPDTRSLFNATVAGRYAQARLMDADISSASKLYLLVADTGSNAPERVLPVWMNLQFDCRRRQRRAGLVAHAESTTRACAARRTDADPPSGEEQLAAGLRHRRPGFHAAAGQRSTSRTIAPEIGSTLNPALRFFVFDAEPNMDRLLPPSPELPMPAAAPVDHRAGRRRSDFLVGAGARAIRGGAADGGSRDRRPARPGQALARGGGRPAVGGADEAGIPVDL